MTDETYNKLRSERSPLWSIAAPDTEAPERNGNLRSWEAVDRERQARFRRWLGPDLYGWLSEMEDKNGV